MPQGFRVVQAEGDLIVPLSFDRGKLTLALGLTRLMKSLLFGISPLLTRVLTPILFT